MKLATRSFSRTLPSSSSFITLVVVATTFVSDARSNIVSSVIGSTDGTRARCPTAFRYKTRLPRPMRTTAPGSFLSAIACSMRGGISSNRELSMVGAAGARCASVGEPVDRTSVSAASGRRANGRIMRCLIIGPCINGGRGPTRMSASITRCRAPEIGRRRRGLTRMGGFTTRYRAPEIVLALGLILLCGAPAFAQAHIVGTVKDSSDRPIKGATITAENPNAAPSTYTTTTDRKGRFAFLAMRAGEGGGVPGPCGRVRDREAHGSRGRRPESRNRDRPGGSRARPPRRRRAVGRGRAGLAAPARGGRSPRERRKGRRGDRALQGDWCSRSRALVSPPAARIFVRAEGRRAGGGWRVSGGAQGGSRQREGKGRIRARQYSAQLRLRATSSCAPGRSPQRHVRRHAVLGRRVKERLPLPADVVHLRDLRRVRAPSRGDDVHEGLMKGPRRTIG